MQLYTIYILKIVLYFVLMFSMYGVVRYYRKRNKNLPWVVIFLMSIAYGYYSLMIGSPALGSDRGNYATCYVSNYDVSERESPGLNWAYGILRPISLEPNFLFITFATCYMLLTLIVIRYYRSMSARAFLFLLCSLYPLTGFYLLKQCISQVLASMSLLLILYSSKFNGIRLWSKKILYLVLAVFLLWGAVAFHEAAYVVCLVAVALLFWHIKMIRVSTLVCSSVGIVVGGLMLRTLLANIGAHSENLANQTTIYADGTEGNVSNIFTFIKGMPFYVMTYIALVWRKRLNVSVEEYDKYLLFLLIISCSTFASSFNYWLYRFSFYFYIPALSFCYWLYVRLKEKGVSGKWYEWSFYITLLLSIKEISQYYFLYGGL